jgi:Helicase associated domain
LDSARVRFSYLPMVFTITMTQQNDGYYHSFTMWDTSGGMDNSSDRMVRRGSMQPLSFMDLTFFPVREGDSPADMTNKLSAASPLVAVGQSTMPATESAIYQMQQQQYQQQQQQQHAYHHAGFRSDHPTFGAVYSSHNDFVDAVSEDSDPISEPTLVTASMDSSEHSDASSKCLTYSSDLSASVSSGSSSSIEAHGSGHRFKPFHDEKWDLRYKELLEFHRVNGHTAVPHTYPTNPQLARWVKRQRRQYKLLKEGKTATMTTERVDLLDLVGFIWDSHDLNWSEKLEALTAFRRVKGHCSVPTNYSDKKLATWVKCQRRQYKLYWDGKPSAMNLGRITALEKVGFEWGTRATAGLKIPKSFQEPSVVVYEENEEEPEPLSVHAPSVIDTTEQLFLVKAIASL